MNEIDHSNQTAAAAEETPKPIDQPAAASRKRRWVWPTAILGGALLIAAGLGIWWVITPDSPGDEADGGATSGGTSGGGGASGGVQLYQSGMHPWIITTEPGNCPICGMKLEPIDASKLTGELAIDPTVVQNMGVRTKAVVTGSLTQTIRTVGRVTVDETGVRTINTKIDGWIEELFVDTEGERVEAGDPLFSVYSPQLYAAQEEYLAAVRREDPTADSADSAGGLTSAATDLLDAARQRLRYFDLSEQQIADLEEREEPRKAVTVASPFTGVVTQKHANEGMRIDPGMPVYTLADLSRVWVQATVYEQQLPFLQEGAAATMTLDYLPGREFEGVVDFIYPTLEQGSREVRVRLVFDNPEGVLKPGMFATVRIAGSPATTMDEGETSGGVLVPRSAVIDTGERQVAFVSLGRGRFEPRELELGVSVDDDRVQVLSGLEPGEQVVISGQFLLDSESRLRESLAKMMAPSEAAPAPGSTGETASVPAPGAGGADDAVVLDDVPAEVRDASTAITRAYLDIQEALTRSDLAAAKRPLDEMVRLAHADAMPPVVEAIAGPAHQAMEAGDLAAFRNAFVPLTATVEAVVRHIPPSLPGGGPLAAAYCPMVERPWLQTGEAIRNPYDPAMLTCGEITQTLPLAGASGAGSNPIHKP